MHLESPALRGAVKLINTMTPRPNPQGAFSTLDETESRVLEHMQAAGLSVP